MKFSSLGISVALLLLLASTDDSPGVMCKADPLRAAFAATFEVREMAQRFTSTSDVERSMVAMCRPLKRNNQGVQLQP